MSSTRRHPNVVNLDELAVPEPFGQGQLQSLNAPVARAAGGQQLGASHYTLAPGCAAFPHHWHGANEEALFVLEGTGTLRIGEAEVVVRAGDWASFPPGPEYAHQLTNTGAGPLRYLCFSTMISPELCGYPDSGKVATFYRRGGVPVFRGVFYEEEKRGYYDREPLAHPAGETPPR